MCLFVVGLFVGSIFGVILMGLICGGKLEDQAMGRLKEEE
ncbi:DUF3789 domain-containing protein [Enterococcus sp. ZJ1668]|nr:DUF3789 domain-containing protein [Enterococcus sp. ZJ1668]